MISTFRPAARWMAVVRSPGFTASRAALVAMTRMEPEFFHAQFRRIPRRLRGMGDGLRLEPPGFVKPLAEARLPALFVDRPHLAPRHVGHQQLDRVGADINDGAPHGFHKVTKLRGNLIPTQVKKCYIWQDCTCCPEGYAPPGESVYLEARHCSGTQHAGVQDGCRTTPHPKGERRVNSGRLPPPCRTWTWIST
jgi:hypothetical protein